MRAMAGFCLIGCVALTGCVDPLPPPATDSPASPSADKAPPAGQIPLERVEANADTAGTKGKGYGGGMITEPLRQNFRLRYKLVFLQIKDGLNKYRAVNGRYPKSYDEFIREIVKPRNLKLPDLPPGQSYAFDSKTGKLMVQRRRNP